VIILCSTAILRADPGDRVEVDEPIAQIETDKVLL
jgi:pyruvate/2-oxoglutarate dehydrogenase complex dihydrolipoamide acyltransferase (E2) component